MRVVVAKRPFKGHAVGSEIEVSAKDARVLIAVGRAAPVVPVVVAEVVAEVVVAEPVKEKRTYRRRDMSAEASK